MMNSIWICWDYFPEQKGLVTGIGLAGYGTGPFVLGPLFTYLINPQDLPAVSSLFPPEVFTRIPWAFRTIAVGYAVLGMMSILALKPINTVKNTVKRRENLADSIMSRQFLVIFGITLCGFTWWGFVIGMIKTFAIENGMADHFVSFALSLASLAGIAGRIVCPVLSDMIGHKAVLGSIFFLNIGLSSLICLGVQHRFVFALMACLMFFTCSGIYPCIAVLMSDVFGDRKSQDLFPLMYVAVILAGGINLGCAYLTDLLGFFYVFIMFSVILALGLILIIKINRKLKVPCYYQQLL